MNEPLFPCTNALQTPNPPFWTTKTAVPKFPQNGGSTPTPCLDKAVHAQGGGGGGTHMRPFIDMCQALTSRGYDGKKEHTENVISDRFKQNHHRVVQCGTYSFEVLQTNPALVRECARQNQSIYTRGHGLPQRPLSGVLVPGSSVQRTPRMTNPPGAFLRPRQGGRDGGEEG